MSFSASKSMRIPDDYHSRECSPRPPLASVLLPVFNAERFVCQAIQSVLTQTFQDFELLLLDDGSTDRSPEIIRDVAAHDCRCRVFMGPNRGLIATLNNGILLARGEFIIRMDADDISMPNRFAKQIEFLQRNPQHVAVGSRLELTDPEGLPICEVIDCYSHEQIEAALLTPRLGIPHAASSIRRSALVRIGGYCAEYVHAEDLDLFLRLAEVGKLANLPDVLYKYRQNLSSICYQYRHKQAEAAANAISSALARRGITTANAFQYDVDSLTASQVHMLWAWWALQAGNVRTARKHALARLRRAPLSKESWRVALCAARGF
jgi:glycosyltransferase involved in cell wall biosynthesis